MCTFSVAIEAHFSNADVCVCSFQISHVLPENWTHTLWNQANDRVMPQYA